jgi:hypothetical protein
MQNKVIASFLLCLFLLACQWTTPPIPESPTLRNNYTGKFIYFTPKPYPITANPDARADCHLPGTTIAPSKTPTITPVTLTPTPLPSATTEPSSIFALQPLGQSYNGHVIEAYKFGDGDTILIFVGGIHGGYEWNTILLAYTAIDYFQANPQTIPPNITLYIIPSANPDGQFLVTGKEGRFVPNDLSPDTISGRFNGA